MNKLSVNLGERSYPIYVGENLLSQAVLRPYIKGEQVLIITNTVLAPLYLDKVCALFSDIQCDQLILPNGEVTKTLRTVEQIFNTLIERKHRRTTTLIALGGGVIGDMTGFAAACYQRGVNFIQIPTTLLAQVDASVGGKTAVNHPQAKNMIGAFHQPKAVVIDTSTLSTLPEREYASGLAEIIKAALIDDAEFFFWLEEHLPNLLKRDAAALNYAIMQACAIKIKIVAEDEKETGLRALLNLGHTFGHAIEQITGYQQWLHGEAVAIGLLMAARHSAQIGWLDHKKVDRIKKILTMANLPIRLPNDISVKQMIACMDTDKKKDSAGIKLVLLKDIGQAVLSQQIDLPILERVITESYSD